MLHTRLHFAKFQERLDTSELAKKDLLIVAEMYSEDFFYLFRHTFNPIHDWSFRGCSWMEERGKKSSLPKISHTYPTTMKLGTFVPYLKKIQKIYEPRDNHWALLISAFLYRKSTNFAILKNRDIDCILIHNF